MPNLPAPVLTLVAATCAIFSTGLPVTTSVSGAQDQVPDVLTRSRALYPTLKSYADTGVVTVERDGFTDHARFTTAFRQPTDFFFEYSAHASVYTTGQRVENPTHLVLWMMKGELQRWDGALKTHDVIPRESGGQVGVLVSSGVGSESSAILVSSLIFVKAGIVGPVQEFVNASLAGEESVNGRRCHKVIGTARSVYPTGAVTNIRPMTVWIDAEHLLILKVLEDTPKGYPAGSISRRTITLKPQANIPLADARFQYKVPG